MSQSTSLPSRASFESIRKQAKKLARDASAGDPEALARVRRHLPDIGQSIALRNAQFVLAREYGFSGWQDLRAAVLRAEGRGMEWATGESLRALHDNKPIELRKLVEEFPTLIEWRDEFGRSLLDQAISSFGDSGDSFREQRFTRIECAELLLQAGAAPKASAWEDAIRSRSHGVLDLLVRHGVAPRNLEVLASLGDFAGVQEQVEAADAKTSGKALLAACRFAQRDAAALLLDRCIALDGDLEARVEGWLGRAGFIDYLISHAWEFETPWQTAVMCELIDAIEANNLQKFSDWLDREPELLCESGVPLQRTLLEQATLQGYERFIDRLLEVDPAIARISPPPPSIAMTIAFDYGLTRLVPILSKIWPVPDDLCHAAGLGDFARVRGWFDEEGRPQLGDLANHYPTNNPHILGDLHWGRPEVQQVLDVALAWACLNGHLDVAAFLLDHGANVNTNWSTHEPASILHECVGRRDYGAAQFLVDRGIDMSIVDYRWGGTAEGWARYATKDEKMADFLAAAANSRQPAHTASESKTEEKSPPR